MPPRDASGHDVPAHSLPPRTNHCFGCGPANPDGLGLRFTVMEEPSEPGDGEPNTPKTGKVEAGGRVFCRFEMPAKFQGPPGHIHGGVIATILDEAMGKANKLAGVVALTRTMEIEFLRPVPLEQPLVVEGWGLHRDGRKHTNAAHIRTETGEILARSQGLFIAIDPSKMFAPKKA